MKRSMIMLSLSVLTACQPVNTDAIEAHHIIASPAQRWVHWDNEAPIDVTQDRVKSKNSCTEPKESY